MKNKIAKIRIIFPIAFSLALFLAFSLPQKIQAIEWFENFDDEDYIHNQQHFDFLANNGNTGPFTASFPVKSGIDKYYKVHSNEATTGVTPFWFGMNGSDMGMRYKFDLQIGPQTGTYRHDATFYRFLQAGQIEQNAIMLKYFPIGNPGSGYFYTNTSNGSLGSAVNNFSSPTLRFQIGNTYKYLNNTDLNQYREQWINVEIEMYCSSSSPHLKIWINGNLDFYREGTDILNSCWTDQRFFGNYYPSEAGGQSYLSVDNFYKFDTTKNTTPDTIPPAISNFSPGATLLPGTTQTVMSLDTDKNAICRYSTAPSIPYNSMTETFTETGIMHHSQLLTGMYNGYSQNYYIRCINTDGYAITTDFMRTISVSGVTDIYPPELYNGSPSGYLPPGTTSVNMHMSTNENSTCKYDTTLGNPYPSMTGTFTTTGETTHGKTLSSLNPGSHTYFIRCMDSLGNYNSSPSDYLSVNFNIQSDTIPPQRYHISPESSLAYGTTSANIILKTDEDATCKFATTQGRDFDTQMTDFSTTGNTQTHSHTISSLTGGNGYEFYIKCEDENNNVNSDDYVISFSVESDDIPPVRSSGSPSGTLNAGTTNTLLTLNTDENSTCRYALAPNISFGSMTGILSPTTTGTGHSASISGLLNGSANNYYVRCQDLNSNPNIDDFLITFSVASESSTSSDSSGNSDEIDVDIENPTSGEVIIDKEFTFKADTNNTDYVKFYYKKSGSVEKIYLGEDDTDDSGLFTIKVNIEDEFDNGDYTLVARAIDGNDDKSDETKFSVKLTYAETQTSTSATTATTSAEEAVTTTNDNTTNTAPVSNAYPTTTTPAAPQLAAPVDSDEDGIPDSEEIKLGTDPDDSDSDGDGVVDEDEIIAGTDPNQSGTDGSDKITFESAKDKGDVDEKNKVNNVEMIEKNGKKILKFSGQSVPNSYVTLYVYSDDPIIVRVKTDVNGNWNYEMDEDLEDGEHEVYIALTDAQGKMKTKSEPLRFVKTAEAISVIPFAEAAPSDQSPVEKMKNNFWYVIIVISVIFIIIAIIILSFIAKKEKSSEPIQPTVSS